MFLSVYLFIEECLLKLHDKRRKNVEIFKSVKVLGFLKAKKNLKFGLFGFLKVF